MKGNIIPEQCIACGRCELVAPHTLDYLDNGIIKFKNSYDLQKSLTSAETEELKKAIKVCPTRAIFLSE